MPGPREDMLWNTTIVTAFLGVLMATKVMGQPEDMVDTRPHKGVTTPLPGVIPNKDTLPSQVTMEVGGMMAGTRSVVRSVVRSITTTTTTTTTTITIAIEARMSKYVLRIPELLSSYNMCSLNVKSVK
jgi:hypothetical protein